MVLQNPLRAVKLSRQVGRHVHMAMEAVAQAGTRIIQILGIRAMATVKIIPDQVTAHTTTPPQVGEAEAGHITATDQVLDQVTAHTTTPPQVGEAEAGHITATDQVLDQVTALAAAITIARNYERKDTDSQIISGVTRPL